MSIHFEPTWESLSQFTIPTWYENAKFGIFIHWGIFSVPAFDNEWYSRNMYIQGSRAFEHHRATWGDHAKFGYKDFIPMFKAENFDADAWVSLFKGAGAQYVIPVAEHHDGFAMYDSAHSQWTAAKMGPKRDVIGELAAAVRGQGLHFGVSNHRAEHWWFMNGGKLFDSDVQNPEFDDFYGPASPSPMSYLNPTEWDSLDWNPRPNAKFMEDWLTRNCELVDLYQPEVYYFDWWIQQIVFAPYIQRFAAYYYNRGQEWGKQVAINCKNIAFPDGTVVFDVERGQLNHIRPLFWQTDTSVSRNSWCYIQDNDYKTPRSLIHDLIDIVSKNGTLLLNIGPKPDGTIPEPEVAILTEIGRWLGINGEAIYGSRPWKIYGEGPTQIVEGPFQDGKPVVYTPQDVRFTTKGETLYAHALGVPENGEIVVKSLAENSDLYPGAVNKISLLGSDQPIEWTRDGAGLKVKIPTVNTSEPALVLKIER